MRQSRRAWQRASGFARLSDLSARPAPPDPLNAGSLRSGGAREILAPMQDPVTRLTNELIASYARVGGINHLDGKNLPSKRVVTSLAKDLLRLLFPGFFDEKLIHSSEIKVETAARLDAIIGPLEDEIRKSLEYNPPPEYGK